MNQTNPHIAYVGHVTEDITSEGAVAGGSVVYGGGIAAALGASVDVYTAHQTPFVLSLPSGPRWHVQSDAKTTQFVNTYDAHGGRTQTVLSAAAAIEYVPVEADVIHLAPVLHEIDLSTWCRKRPEQILAVSLQGFLRHTDGLPAQVTSRPIDAARLHGVDLLFLSDEDMGPHDGLLQQLHDVVPIVVLTKGMYGSQVFAGDHTIETQAVRTRVVDPTGAGDAYAAGFLVSYCRGEPLEVAAKAGVRAASAVISARGWSAVSGLASMDEPRDT